jgi:Uma2 family endonuclease
VDDGGAVDVLIPRADEVHDEVDSVVQPDIVVFCGGSRIREDNARGAPDLAVEILSPSTSNVEGSSETIDQNEKFRLYERAGVREYWVVDPAGRWLCVYRLGAGLFDEGELRESPRDYGPIASRVIEGFSVNPSRLFAELE